MIPERKKSPEAVDPSCARSERANPGYGHQKGMAVGHPNSESNRSPAGACLKGLPGSGRWSGRRSTVVAAA
jgi:hypothetical protein